MNLIEPHQIFIVITFFRLNKLCVTLHKMRGKGGVGGRLGGLINPFFNLVKSIGKGIIMI